jgi:transcriptional regulator GlxA family with amidase domain
LKKEKSTATVDHSTVAKLRQAREYVIQHRASNFTLSDLAKTVDMSPSTLSKGFKQVFGNTVLGFLLEERMRRAMELLRTTDQNIFDIARLTGYKNISSFSSAFKSHFGYAPRHSNRQRQT